LNPGDVLFRARTAAIPNCQTAICGFGHVDVLVYLPATLDTLRLKTHIVPWRPAYVEDGYVWVDGIGEILLNQKIDAESVPYKKLGAVGYVMVQTLTSSGGKTFNGT
jgi:hypothetical protein